MLVGYSMIEGESRRGNGAEFWGLNPVTGARLDPVYHSADAAEVNLAGRLAAEAFEVSSKLSGAEKARFLRHIAAGLEADHSGYCGSGA